MKLEDAIAEVARMCRAPDDALARPTFNLYIRPADLMERGLTIADVRALVAKTHLGKTPTKNNLSSS